MCGIAGIVLKGVNNDAHSLVNTMLNAIQHRGPDGDGVFTSSICTLGHRRLSIIDLKSGDQPMLSDNRNCSIVFNGEIYGYKNIKNKLHDYQFHTTSDTEVILALYKKYGELLCEKLPGMFSFAIWDEKKQQLFCARDRFGEKPFFYTLTKDGTFIFASEIKAILATKLINPLLSKESLAHYLQHLYVHPHHSIYKDIFVLPPGHSLTVENGKCKIKRYWKIPEIQSSITLNQATEKFKALLEISIQNQLVADVQVGAFLSGGFDSSLIVALASKYKKNIKTFSFGFGDDINELPYARLVADKFKTDHIEIQQSLPDLGELLVTMQDIYDEPFADSSNIPTYLISKEASKDLKVVLTGDGGDELLGGYSFWYRHLVNIENATSFSGLKKLLLPIFARAGKKIGNNYIPYLNEQQALLNGRRTVEEIHTAQNTYFTNEELASLGLNDLKRRSSDYSFAFENTVDDAMKMDIENYMPGDILVKTDRASMASSLELRAPFLDKEFAEFCISLPYTLKLNYKEEKLIAKRSFKNLLPEPILKRKKQGFGAPVTAWLKSDSLKKIKAEYLGNKSRNIFNELNYDFIQTIAARDNYQTWIILILAIWMEKNPNK